MLIWSDGEIQHEIHDRGVALDDVKNGLLNRLHDYVYHITPQFMYPYQFSAYSVGGYFRSFAAEPVPTADECYLIIHSCDKYWPDFAGRYSGAL